MLSFSGSAARGAGRAAGIERDRLFGLAVGHEHRLAVAARDRDLTRAEAAQGQGEHGADAVRDENAELRTGLDRSARGHRIVEIDVVLAADVDGDPDLTDLRDASIEDDGDDGQRLARGGDLLVVAAGAVAAARAEAQRRHRQHQVQAARVHCHAVCTPSVVSPEPEPDPELWFASTTPTATPAPTTATAATQNQARR